VANPVGSGAVSPRRVLIGSPLLGALLGLTGAFVHASRTPVLGVTVPWGVVLMVAAVLATTRAAVVLAGTRIAGVLLLAGWLVITVLAAVSTTAGDLPVQATWRSLAYLILTPMIGSALVVARAPRMQYQGMQDPAEMHTDVLGDV
jgi:hypothetical protein